MVERDRLLLLTARVAGWTGLPGELLMELDLPGLRKLSELARLERRESWLRALCASGEHARCRTGLEELRAERMALVQEVSKRGE